jgi:hypothetical protein
MSAMYMKVATEVSRRFDELLVTQLIEKLPAFYENRPFITVARLPVQHYML